MNGQHWVGDNFGEGGFFTLIQWKDIAQARTRMRVSDGSRDFSYGVGE